MQELIFPSCLLTEKLCWLLQRLFFWFWSSCYSKSAVSSFHLGTGTSWRTTPTSHSESAGQDVNNTGWKSSAIWHTFLYGLLLGNISCLDQEEEKEGKGLNKNLNAGNKGGPKISSGGPRHFSLKVTLRKEDSLNKEPKRFHCAHNSQQQKRYFC